MERLPPPEDPSSSGDPWRDNSSERQRGTADSYENPAQNHQYEGAVWHLRELDAEIGAAPHPFFSSHSSRYG